MPTEELVGLDRANKVRITRARTKREVARGEVAAADVIRECCWWAVNMTLAELLTSQRGWGRTRMRRFLLGDGFFFNENKRIGDMTSRQRTSVANKLDVEARKR